jgi:hypothetical protein
MSIITSLAGLAARPMLVAAAPWLIGGAVLAAGGFITYQVHHQRDIGREEVRAEWALANATQTAAALQQSQANAAETTRRQAQQKEAQDAHDQELARAQRDAAAAHVAAGRLSSQLAAFTAASRAAGNPGAVANGQAGTTPLDLLADLFSRADGEAGILAEALDRSYAAGRQCERSYESLTATP